jgi:hypothetical protein
MSYFNLFFMRLSQSQDSGLMGKFFFIIDFFKISFFNILLIKN